MSRKFWGTVMVLAALLTAGSSYLMMNRLAEGEAEPQPVPLRQVPPEEVPPMPAVEAPAPADASSNTKDPSSVAPPVPASERPVAAVAPDATKKSTTGRRNILFKIARPNAKKVEIIGDFNEWVRQPMKKAGKVWQMSVPLAPGSYEYAFVVDDKRVRDPNNKNSSSGGKASILTVKPLAVPK